MMNLDLQEALAQHQPNVEVTIVYRVKTGYDEGDVYQSHNFTVHVRDAKLCLEPTGSELIGGW